MDGGTIRHDPHPVYLGLTLERTLGYGEHLSKTSSKLKPRSNLLSKLAGSTWGSGANILHTLAFSFLLLSCHVLRPYVG